MDRKLATIRRVAEIKPIPKADNIECLVVDGWTVVSQKGIHKVNDLIVFFEIDSFLPVIPQFEWMRKNCFRSTAWGGDGFRVKTVKLRGQLSQGLAMPISDFDGFRHSPGPQEGDDVTEFLKVQKWDPPVNDPGVARGNFPSFIRKTDQERVQNIYNKLVKENQDTLFEVTTKLDGSSMTIYCTKKYPDVLGETDWEVGVCSRNLDQLEDDDNIFWKCAKESLILGALKIYCKNHDRSLALQGELMGPGVQGNKEKLTKLHFYLFDIWDIDTQKYLTPGERRQLRASLSAEVGVFAIDHVPVIDFFCKVFARYKTLDELLKFANQMSLYRSTAEGIVLKAVDGSVSFKIINNEYLIKEED